eukprot:3673608-Prymnesium_polylepis.2
MCSGQQAIQRMAGSSARRRCCIRVSLRQSDGRSGRECMWLPLALVGTRPSSTVHKRFGLRNADGSLAQRTRTGDSSMIGLAERDLHE